jgi:hypothetical protein
VVGTVPPGGGAGAGGGGGGGEGGDGAGGAGGGGPPTGGGGAGLTGAGASSPEPPPPHPLHPAASPATLAAKLLSANRLDSAGVRGASQFSDDDEPSDPSSAKDALYSWDGLVMMSECLLHAVLLL